MSEVPSISEMLDRLQKSPEKPSIEWLSATCQMLLHFPVQTREKTVISDERGLPHFCLSMPELHSGDTPVTIAEPLDQIIERKFGFMLFLPQEDRTWCFSHGRMLSCKLYDSPYTPNFWDLPEQKTECELIMNPEKLMVDPPNEEMLSLLVRDSLRWAMQTQLVIPNPRVGLIARPENEPGVSRIMFDIDPDPFGGIEQTLQVMEFLKWFMPPCVPVNYLPGLKDAPWMVPL